MPKSIAAASAKERIKSIYPEGGPGRNLKKRLEDGEILLGATIAEYCRPSLIKIYQQVGFDFVYIEYEHTFFDMPTFAATVLSARDNALPVIAKTPQLERQEIAKLLECGAIGIQLPRTETRSQVEELMSYIKFPPAGTRALSADVIINESKCLISSLRTPTAFVSALPLNEFEHTNSANLSVWCAGVCLTGRISIKFTLIPR